MSIPNNNVNLCFVGGVSTGKSTGLNGVFCQKLTDCKIKRTTMVPTVYIEHNSHEMNVSPDEIFQKIANKNKELIEKSESGQHLTAEDYKETVFNVGKLDIKILDDCLVNIYDIPGLNDARTKDIYYHYLEKQFNKFNIILFFVDINSGLNTSDEMDILKFIVSNTQEHISYGRKIYTLVIVNKADDMQLDAEKNLTLIGEMAEMFEQVENTVKSEFDRNEIGGQLLGVIPFCALDAYLYRMVKKYGENYKLTTQEIQKIGVNEMGKKFSILKPAEQEEKVYGILKDQEFIDSMIQLSGFSTLETKLRKCMIYDGLGKELQIDNLIQELKRLPPINQEIFSRKMWNQLLVNKTAVQLVETNWTVQLVETNWNLFQKVKSIDPVRSMTLIIEFLDNIIKLIQIIIIKSPLHNIVENYDSFIARYISPYFYEYYDITKYPEYFVEKIIQRLKIEWFTKRPQIPINTSTLSVVSGFKIIEKLKLWNRETVESIVKVIIANDCGFNSIGFNNDMKEFGPLIEFNNDMKEFGPLIEILRDIEELKIPSFKELLRFLLLNYYAEFRGTTDDYHRRVMLYRYHREVNVLYYLESKVEYRTPASIQVYMNPVDTTQGMYSLDMFYLNYLEGEDMKWVEQNIYKVLK